MINEKTALVHRLEELENQIQRYKQCDEFLQRMSRLDKYLQAPDQSSDYGKYELAVAAYSEVAVRLNYVRTQRSQLRRFLCFLGLIDTIPELEGQLARHAWRVDQLCRKLKLAGNISLQQEYRILDDHLKVLMAQGFAPSLVSEHIRTLENEKNENSNQLAKFDEHLKPEQTKKVHYLPDRSDQAKPVQAKPIQAKPVQAKPVQKEFSPPPQSAPKRQALYTHLNFWEPLEIDLNSAQNAVVIVSPYLTVKRSKKFMKTFKTLRSRNVGLKVITLPTKLQTDHMVDQSASVVNTLLELGVEVITVPKIHQKIIVIDDKICWEGSMNWLSHRDTAEHIRRIDDSELVAEVNESLNMYLKPTEAQYSDQPMIVRTNYLGPESKYGSSLIHQEYVNVSPDDIEALLYDCPCCDGGDFGPIFSGHT